MDVVVFVSVWWLYGCGGVCERVVVVWMWWCL